MKKEGWKSKIDWPVFSFSGGVLVLFVVMSSLFTKATSKFVEKGFQISITYFGAFWQILLLATFAVGLFLIFSKYGRVRLGNTSKPEMGFFKWAAIVITAGLGAGAIFWAAAEPMYYFIDVPPTMGSNIENKSTEAIPASMAQSFTSWGFTAWAVYGAVSGIIIMYAHYNKGMKIRPRTLLYPIFGKKIEYNSTGSLIDVLCILGAVAGTIGTIGFFGFQFSYWMHSIFGVPDNIITQILSVVGLIIVVTISAVTGIDKGIQFLSKLNIWLAIGIALFILLVGPGKFIIDTFISSYGIYITQFIDISTFRGDDKWAGSWMLFFFGWFIGYGPLMAMLVTGEGDPPKIVRVFWVVVMGVISIILINIGEGSINAIQSFIIITAVPISIIMLPAVWTAPKIAHKLAIEQQLIEGTNKEKNLKFITRKSTMTLNYNQNFKNKE